MKTALQIAATFKPYVQTQLVALLVWVAINLVSLGFEFNQWRQRRAQATSNDDGSRGLLLTGTVLGLALLILSPRLAPGAAIRPAWLAFAGGLTIYLAGFGMRRWSEMTLGRYFTFEVMTSADQPVVTTGPYRYVRHPGYTGVVLVVIGAGVVTGNWVGLAGWTLLVLLPLLYRIHVEESALLRALGETYRSYATRRKRLVPLVW
ncbi:MAG TPA: isoprenylcysteine carboxylmethyltransferase family protein [Solirubrobacteraceae bacterium]